MARIENVELADVAEYLVGLTVKDVNELSNILKEKYGIEPMSATVVTAVGGDGGAPGGAEKSSFNVVIKNLGTQKLAVIKLLKEVLGVGLKEAKDLAEAVGKPVKENVSKAEAEELKGKLVEAGAEVELV